MRTRIALVVVAVTALCAPAAAQWDATKPAQGGALTSADFRNNWTAIEKAIGHQNLLQDPTFLVWAAGDSASPTGYATSGTGHAVARTGVGLADTNRRTGDFATKLVSGASATAYLTQFILPSDAYDDGFDGMPVACGAWVKTSVASAVRLYFADGGATSVSTYHTGGGAWEWLKLTHTTSATATVLQWALEVAAGTVTAYISAPTCLLGQIPPADFVPAPTIVRDVHLLPTNLANFTTDLSVATGVLDWTPNRLGFVTDVQCHVFTAPTGGDVILDVNTFDGSGFTSMFTSGNRPTITASGNRCGGNIPDVYARRGLAAHHGPTNIAGGEVRVDVDQVGPTVKGARLSINIRVLQWARPLEAFLNPTNVR